MIIKHKSAYERIFPEAYNATQVLLSDATDEQKAAAYTVLLQTVLSTGRPYLTGLYPYISVAQVIEFLGFARTEIDAYHQRYGIRRPLPKRLWGLQTLKNLQAEGVELKRGSGYKVRLSTIQAYVQRQIDILTSVAAPVVVAPIAPAPTTDTSGPEPRPAHLIDKTRTCYLRLSHYMSQTWTPGCSDSHSCMLARRRDGSVHIGVHASCTVEAATPEKQDQQDRRKLEKMVRTKLIAARKAGYTNCEILECYDSYDKRESRTVTVDLYADLHRILDLLTPQAEMRETCARVSAEIMAEHGALRTAYNSPGAVAEREKRANEIVEITSVFPDGTRETRHVPRKNMYDGPGKLSAAVPKADAAVSEFNRLVASEDLAELERMFALPSGEVATDEEVANA
jgi:hypothetical protein